MEVHDPSLQFLGQSNYNSRNNYFRKKKSERSSEKHEDLVRLIAQHGQRLLGGEGSHP